MVGPLRAIPDLQRVRSPLTPVIVGQVSEDAHSAYVSSSHRATPTTPSTSVGPPRSPATDDAQAAHPRSSWRRPATRAPTTAIDGAYRRRLRQGAMLSLPITLIILLLALARSWPPSIPLLLA